MDPFEKSMQVHFAESPPMFGKPKNIENAVLIQHVHDDFELVSTDVASKIIAEQRFLIEKLQKLLREATK